MLLLVIITFTITALRLCEREDLLARVLSITKRFLSTSRLNEHDCKICKKTVGISLVFKEFDMARSTSISGMEVVINKLNEIIKLM